MKLVYWFVPILLATSLMSGCVNPAPVTSPATSNATPVTEISTPVVSVMPQGTDGYPWWNDTTFYEIFVRSFSDSDGDGIGDFNGITQKLDYLNDGDPNTTSDLGITGIWLMPINPSPSYHGYSVTDYYRVNHQYGTMDDFKNLLNEAHKRGIRVIIDLVINHTSDRNKWFLNSYERDSPFHDWYIWSDTNPGYAGAWGQKVWHPYKERYYYANFDQAMPDLNFENPEVIAEIQNITRFWLEEVGIDGFRLDAAKHIIEEGRIQTNTASTHEWWKSYRPFYKGINPDAMIVGEVWDETVVTAEYLQGDQFDLSFEFKLSNAFIEAVKRENASGTNFQIKFSYNQIPELRFATFLANHDQNRLIDQLGNDPQKVKVAASLLLTAPGVPFLYYGEETGMQGSKPDENIRAPMQWSSETNGGFSIGTPWMELGAGWEAFNVADETDDPSSILSHFRTLIQTRNQHSALRVGTMSMVSTGNNDLYALLRQSEEESLLVLINLGDTLITQYALTLNKSGLEQGNYTPAFILGEGTLSALSVNAEGGFFNYVPLDEIQPYETVIIRLD